jgi:hypothetical protein
MAEYGEWGRKGATLSDVTAKKEFGVSREFIIEGIKSGDLEYRNGSVWGAPYLRLLRSQLEAYIAKKLGADHLASGKNKTELRKIKKEIDELRTRLIELENRREVLEAVCGKKPKGK